MGHYEDLTIRLAFSESYNSGKVVGTSVQNASCKTRNGAYVASSIDLGLCYKNSDGVLIYQMNGGFLNCKDFSVSGSSLKAKCKSMNNGSIKNTINLDTYIGNDNGVLKCDQY